MKISICRLLALPVVIRDLAVAHPFFHNAVVRHDVRHRHLPGATVWTSPQHKRSSTVSTALELNDHWVYSGAYFLDLEIGTPPQKVEVLLDTGSSDLFVPSGEASSCLNNNCPGGSFSRHRSTSFRNEHEPAAFKTAYLDGSSASGGYGRDIVSIGGVSLDDHTLAIADEIEVSPHYQYGPGPQYGILGLSFVAQESSVCASAPESCKINFTTPTVLDSLYNAGLIKSRSFSLFLDDVEFKTGSILFGGLDTAKFNGELVTLSIHRDDHRNSWTYGLYVSQSLFLTSLSGNFNGTSTQYTPEQYSSTAILDSGASALTVPPFIFDQLVSSAPIVLQHEGSAAMLCKDMDPGAYLTVGLAGINGAATTIDIPMSNLVMPIFQGPYAHPQPYTYQGEELCVFAVARGTASHNLLGDPLLRSAYTVFNLDERTVSIAQASYRTTESDVKEVRPGTLSSQVRSTPND